MMVFTALLVLLSLTQCSAQTTSGYSTAPYYVQTFDVEPSESRMNQSGGGFTWVREVAGHKGLAYINRAAQNYIDLAKFPGQSSHLIPSIINLSVPQ